MSLFAKSRDQVTAPPQSYYYMLHCSSAKLLSHVTLLLRKVIITCYIAPPQSYYHMLTSDLTELSHQEKSNNNEHTPPTISVGDTVFQVRTSCPFLSICLLFVPLSELYNLVTCVFPLFSPCFPPRFPPFPIIPEKHSTPVCTVLP